VLIAGIAAVLLVAGGIGIYFLLNPSGEKPNADNNSIAKLEDLPGTKGKLKLPLDGNPKKDVPREDPKKTDPKQDTPKGEQVVVIPKEDLKKEDPRKDDPKKDDPKKDDPKKDDPKKDDPKQAVDPPGKAYRVVVGGQYNHVKGLMYRGDGKILFAGYSDGTIRWFDAATLEEKGKLVHTKAKQLSGLAVTPDGKTVAIVTSNNLLELVDVATSSVRVTLQLIELNVIPEVAPAVAFSPDGKVLASIHTSGTVRLWDVTAEKELRTINHDGKALRTRGLAFSPDSKVLITADADNRLRLWDVTSGKELASMAGDEQDKFGSAGAQSNLALAGDGKRAAAAWAREQVRIWYLPARKQRPLLNVKTPYGVGRLAFSSDGKVLAVAHLDGKVQLWDVLTSRELATLTLGPPEGNTPTSGSVAVFSPDDRKLATAYKGDVQVWDLGLVSLAKIDPSLVVADPQELPAKPGEPARKETVHVAGKVERHFGGGIDIESQSMLLTLPNGVLKHYSYPDLLPLGTYYLPDTGARAVLDNKNKRLYAFVTRLQAGVAPPDYKFGPGDLHLYDVKDILDGKAEGGRKLTPLRTVKLDLRVSDLAVNAEGTALYYLGVKRDGAHIIGRVDPTKGAVTGEAYLSGGTNCMCLTRDGKTIYAGAPGGGAGFLQILPTATMRVEQTLGVSIKPYSLDAAEDGRIFVSGTVSGSPQVVVLDFKEKTPAIASWPLGMADTYLKLSHDQRKLYLSNWRLSPASVRSANIPEPTAGSRLPGGSVAQVDANFNVRGEQMVSPDGKYLLCESGALLQLRDAGIFVAENEPKSDPFKKEIKPPDDPFKKEIRPPDDPFKKDPRPRPGMANKIEVAQPVGRIEAYLGAVFDAKNGLLLLTLPNGQLKAYTYPEFRPKGTYKLSGKGYEPAYDAERGLLYVLTPNLKANDPTTRRGGSQVLVYDLKKLTEGKAASGELKPVQTIALGDIATHLAVSPDGDWVYTLQVKDSKTVKAQRFNAKGEASGEVALAEYTDVLCLSRDGKGLYAIAHSAPRGGGSKPGSVTGTVQLIDPATMRMKKSVNVNLDPFDIDTGPDGLVFLSGAGGQTCEVVILNLSQESPLLATWKGVPSNACLRLSEDGSRLYVSAMKASAAWLGSLNLPDPLIASDLPQTRWVMVQQDKVRGEVVVSPDGQFLLNETGVVFMLKEEDGTPKGKGGERFP
jgi:WD40 repeat protein